MDTHVDVTTPTQHVCLSPEINPLFTASRMNLSFNLAVKNSSLGLPTYFGEAAVTEEVSEVGTDTWLLVSVSLLRSRRADFQNSHFLKSSASKKRESVLSSRVH